MAGALPLSGTEPMFDEALWGTVGRERNNCLAYAMYDFSDTRNHKSQPGERSGLDSVPYDADSCGALTRRMLADNPGRVYVEKPEVACRAGHHKIMMVVSPSEQHGGPKGNGTDFHFYRQSRGVRYTVKAGDTPASIAKFLRTTQAVILKAAKGAPLRPGSTLTIPDLPLWSHKRGFATGALLEDASGTTIVDPRTANRRYDGYDCNTVCNSFCARTGVANVNKGQ